MLPASSLHGVSSTLRNLDLGLDDEINDHRAVAQFGAILKSLASTLVSLCLSLYPFSENWGYSGEETITFECLKTLRLTRVFEANLRCFSCPRLESLFIKNNGEDLFPHTDSFVLYRFLSDHRITLISIDISLCVVVLPHQVIELPSLRALSLVLNFPAEFLRAVRAPRLEELAVGGVSVAWADISPLLHLETLRSISIDASVDFTTPSDLVQDPFALSFPSLETMNLRFPSSAVLSQLKRFPALKVVILHRHAPRPEVGILCKPPSTIH